MKQPRLLEAIRKAKQKKLSRVFCYMYIFKFFFFIFVPIVEFFKDFISYTLNRYFIIKTLQIYFSVLRGRPTANSVVREIILRFGLEVRRSGKYRYQHILRRLVKKLQRSVAKQQLLGFKIAFTGRFTRRERLTYKWERRGTLAISTTTGLVDYAGEIIQLSHGVCLIEVWLG